MNKRLEVRGEGEGGAGAGASVLFVIHFLSVSTATPRQEVTTDFGLVGETVFCPAGVANRSHI